MHLDKEQESNVKQIDNEETEIIVKPINKDENGKLEAFAVKKGTGRTARELSC